MANIRSRSKPKKLPPKKLKIALDEKELELNGILDEKSNEEIKLNNLVEKFVSEIFPDETIDLKKLEESLNVFGIVEYFEERKDSLNLKKEELKELKNSAGYQEYSSPKEALEKLEEESTFLDSKQIDLMDWLYNLTYTSEEQIGYFIKKSGKKKDGLWHSFFNSLFGISAREKQASIELIEKLKVNSMEEVIKKYQDVRRDLSLIAKKLKKLNFSKERLRELLIIMSRLEQEITSFSIETYLHISKELDMYLIENPLDKEITPSFQVMDSFMKVGVSKQRIKELSSSIANLKKQISKLKLENN